MHSTCVIIDFVAEVEQLEVFKVIELVMVVKEIVKEIMIQPPKVAFTESAET